MDICSYSFEDLTKRLVALGQPAYRARQLFEWLYQKQVAGYDAMSSFSHDFRGVLAREFPFPIINEAKVQKSSDGTIKFLWSLFDDERVETVFIPMEEHHTVCISSQVGCRFGCKFCASGIGGLSRQLTCGEIVGQVLSAARYVRPLRISHVVFMGTGEPFDNYDNVLKAIRILNHEHGLNIAVRRITISTSGVIPGIQRLSEEGKQIELCISLHASNDQMRSKIMPVNIKYPLNDLMAVCRAYAQKTGRQVTFEYILIKGVTCSPEAARELGVLLRGWLCKINCIPYNPNTEFPFVTPSRTEVRRFRDLLEAEGIHTTMRTARGTDISAACGQLRHETGKVK